MLGDNGSFAWLEQLLWFSRTVAFARFSPEGSPKQANDRFLSLFRAGAKDRRLQDLVIQGQRDEIARLLRDREPCDAPRNFNFAEGDQTPTTLLVSWRWDKGDLVMLGEAPVADLEASQEMLVKLNGRVSELMRENAKKSAQLEKALADLARALENLRDSNWLLRRIQELLPMCSYCGKVRVAEDHWQTVEDYLRGNSDFLTHGICPECLERIDAGLEGTNESINP